MALTDEGFHPTVLTLWRNRLRVSPAPERIFDAVRQVVTDTGVLAGRTRRALDSTLLDDAVATQDTVTQLVSVIRRMRRAFPVAATVAVSGHDYESGSKPSCAWDDPVARDELVTGLVNDAVAILDSVAGTDLDDDGARLVGLLGLVAGQDVEPGETEGTWRVARRVSKDRVISTVDPETRHMHKSPSAYRDGYKAHLAVEPETGIITACDLTPANTGDGPVGVQLLAGESPGLEVFGDSAYGSGPMRADLQTADHTAVIKPLPLHRNRRLGDDQFTPRRLLDRLPDRHRHLSERSHRFDQRRRARQVPQTLRRLPLTVPMHHQPKRQDLQRHRTRPVPRHSPDRLAQQSQH